MNYKSGLDQPVKTKSKIIRYFSSNNFSIISEIVARFLGSWRFIGLMTIFIATWLIWNIFLPKDLQFDEYPFIFLTLILSVQASYAAPLILLAQNRQSDRDKVQYEEDRTSTHRILLGVEFNSREIAALRNMAGETVTRDFLRAELKNIVEEMKQEYNKNSINRT